MSTEQGNISVNTENIFPIIKKFLYSDHEIFLRELVSNAVDACQKVNKIATLGEYGGDVSALCVKVTVDKDAKRITISDNGIGMTADEIKRYINQVAFSGASEFLDKYKDKVERKEIIGNFGLGFYSAFMVAERVQIITKSWQQDDTTDAALWSCDGSTAFSIEPTVRQERGTDVVLHIAADSEEFLDAFKLKGILRKYAKFLPITIEVEGEVINQTTPIWTKNPTELTNEDYINFYKELYPLAEEPLFWIHLNVDYPFTLTGVLYFPKVQSGFEIQKEKIQLYSRQVFITDEVKDVVPEFLMLLHGVIDSPDIPLNVSRSYLQADSNVKKINNYITKKVAEKLHELFKEDRANFEQKWQSLGLFVKYGFIAEDKFYEKALPFTLVQNIDGKFFTLDEYRDHVQARQTDTRNNVVWLYATDRQKQFTAIQAVKGKEYDVLLMEERVIDPHFVQAIEQRYPNTQLRRVDADTAEKIIDTGIAAASALADAEQQQLKELFERVLDNKSLIINPEALHETDLPVVITISEHLRRMYEMAKSQGFERYMNPEQQMNVALNTNHALIKRILEEQDPATQADFIRHAYDLALLAQGMLSGESLGKFLQRSITLLQR